MRVAFGWLLGLLVFDVAATTTQAATVRVQYVSNTSVYLDGGRAAGLVEGAAVRVERDGKLVAELVVEFAAENSAACRIVSSTSPPRAGDACTFTAAPAPDSGAGAGAAATPAAPARPVAVGAGGTSDGWNAAAIAGTLAFTYRRSAEPDGSLTNPGLRADVHWNGPAQRELGVRVRADRPAVHFDSPASTPLAAENLRIYEAEVLYRGAGERFELRAGRFIPRRLELMGYMDGAGLAFRPAAGMRLGLAGGGGAQIGADGFQTGGWKLGGFFEAADPRRGPARWRAVVGGARLQDPDITRRQFTYLQFDERLGSRLRAWEHLEVDFNPDWKRALGESSVDLTDVAVGTQVGVHRKVDVALSYEARRDVLLPEQRLVPPDPLGTGRTHGVHGAVHLRFTPWTALRLGADVRTRSDGTRTQRAWDAVLQGGRARFTLLAHANLYDAAPGRGEQFDGSVLARPADRLRLDLAGGTHLIHDLPSTAGAADRRTNWLRLGAGLESPWGLWFDASSEWRSESAGNELRLEVGQRL